MKRPIEGTSFVKDMKNGALLLTSKNALIENDARKKLAAKLNGKNEEINNLKSKVDELSADMKDIKELLNSLLKQSKQ